jgi:hypothetical protein
MLNLPQDEPLQGIAFGHDADGTANALYLLQTDPGIGAVLLERWPLGLGINPAVRWSGAGLGVSLAGLCASGTSLYFGDSGPDQNEIRHVDSLGDAEPDAGSPATPDVVVDIASAFPGIALGPIADLACDATGLAWIQSVGGSTVVLQHDLADSPTAVSVLYAPPPASLGSVAIDGAYVYAAAVTGSIQEDAGCPLGVAPCLVNVSSVLAFARGGEAGAGPIPLASGVNVETPIVAQGGGVYFSPAPAGGLALASPDSPGVTRTTSVPPITVSAFAYDGGRLFVASGTVISYDSTGSGQGGGFSTQSSNILGLAASGGWVGSYTSNLLGVMPEPP